jgi:hypothetical protein
MWAPKRCGRHPDLFWFSRFGRLGPGAESRSFGRHPALVRVWIGDAAALNQKYGATTNPGTSS